MTLIGLKSTGQVYHRIPLLASFWWLCYKDTGIMSFGKEKHKGKVLFSWHHIKGTYYQHAMRADVNLNHLAKVIFFRLLYYKITLSYILFILYFLWKEVTMHITHLSSEELCFPPLNGEYLQKWFVILPHGKYIYL